MNDFCMRGHERSENWIDKKPNPGVADKIAWATQLLEEYGYTVSMTAGDEYLAI